MKPYKISITNLDESRHNQPSNGYNRLIGPGNSVFSLFLKSLPDSGGKFPGGVEYVICDKNPSHLKMFQEIIKWDGSNQLTEHLIESAGKLNLEIELPFAENVIDLCKRLASDYNESWNEFKKSNFKYYNIDVVADPERFINLVARTTRQIKSQYVSMNFIHINNVDHKNAANEILHALWLKSFDFYPSVLQITDENNRLYEDYAGKLYTKLNPSFCILPWMHVQYKPSGQAKLCCRYDTVKENADWMFYSDQKILPPDDSLTANYMTRAYELSIDKTNIEDTFNSDYWKKARDLTVKHLPIVGCHKCYQEEKTTKEVAVSMRLGSSILYNGGYLHKRINHQEPKIEFLEVGFGNYCNLACLTCNSTLSTTWHDDEIKLNKIVGGDLRRTVFPKLDNIKFEPDSSTLKTLKIIKFTGGEPMINPEFTKFIEYICEKGTPENISLEIYTNCSYIPSPKLLSNLERFKNIQLNLSIDAEGQVNDYIRYGSTWTSDSKQSVNNALKFWLEQGVKNKNFRVILSATLSILNVFEVQRLSTWWFELYRNSGNEIKVNDMQSKKEDYEGFFKLQMVFDPSYLSINVLPAEMYKELIEWCITYNRQFMEKYPEYNGVPACMAGNINKLKKALQRARGNKKNAALLIKYLEKMDSIRNNSAEESLPIMLEKVKEYLLTQDTQT